MIQEPEIPKYLKQKESNISKSNRKSKHKHQYEECLIQYNFNFVGKIHITTSLHSYCTICGKIGDRLKDSIVKDYIKSELHIEKQSTLLCQEQNYMKSIMINCQYSL